MQMFIDRATGHRIWNLLKVLGAAIDAAEQRPDFSEDAAAHTSRLRSVLTLIGKRLAATPPSLLAASTLDTLADTVQVCAAEIQSYVANGQIGHLTSTIAHTDRAIIACSEIPASVDHASLETVAESSAACHRTLQSLANGFRRDLEEVDSKLAGSQAVAAEVSASVARTSTQATSLLSEMQAQFSAAQDRRSTDFADSQSTRGAEFAARLAEWVKIAADHDLALRAAASDAQRASADSIAKLTSVYEAQADAKLIAIDKKRGEVERLVGVIGSLGMASGFIKHANFCRTATFVWQALTVLALCGLAYFAYHDLLPVMQGSVEFSAAIARLSMLLVSGLFAAYSSRQADKYFEIERRSRRLGLELEALNPFLAPLPAEARDEFIRQLGYKTFGTDSPLSLRNADRSPATPLDVVASTKGGQSFILELIRLIKG